MKTFFSVEHLFNIKQVKTLDLEPNLQNLHFDRTDILTAVYPYERFKRLKQLN